MLKVLVARLTAKATAQYPSELPRPNVSKTQNVLASPGQKCCPKRDLRRHSLMQKADWNKKGFCSNRELTECQKCRFLTMSISTAIRRQCSKTTGVAAAAAMVIS